MLILDHYVLYASCVLGNFFLDYGSFVQRKKIQTKKHRTTINSPNITPNGNGPVTELS